MTTIHQVRIPSEYIGKRFDYTVSALLPQYSRMEITKWFKKGMATNEKGIPMIANKKIVAPMIIYLQAQHARTQKWQAEELPLDIVFQDDALVVINKPAGMVTHPGAGNQQGTLANALLYHYPHVVELDRAGLVHRLDKDTSGLLVVAKTRAIQQQLVQQIQSHQIVKEYRALVYGYIVAGGEIDEPIGRDRHNRLKKAVDPLGKRAVTHYRVHEHFAHHSYLHLTLVTGRTHQIRVHCAYVNHPIIGDQRYTNGTRFVKGINAPLRQAITKMTRQALHAYRLTLMHPITERKLSWQAPLPQDMTALLKALRTHDRLA